MISLDATDGFASELWPDGLSAAAGADKCLTRSSHYFADNT